LEQTEGLAAAVKEGVNLFAFVAWAAVNKQRDFAEAFDDLLAVFDELLLSFSLEKSVD
jgi:hypothetical protein